MKLVNRKTFIFSSDCFQGFTRKNVYTGICDKKTKIKRKLILLFT